jgi:peptide/nickel transport system permease protein
MSEFRILFSQVLPNSLSPLIVTFTARMATAVLAAAGLSFLGFGVPVPTPEWGALISAGRNFLKMAPYITFYPGIFIMLMAFACALLGDGLRDALDPKLNK